MKDKAELINTIIAHKGYKKYLELGVGYAMETLSQIKCESITSVDINPIAEGIPSFVGTTDDFFKSNKGKFDVIYIDADHSAESVLKDFKNSKQYLRKDGIIFMHDVGPANKQNTLPAASGTAYQVFMYLRSQPEYDAFCFEFENGDVLGMVKLRTQTDLMDNWKFYHPGEDADPWNMFEKHRDIILRKKSIEEILILV